MFPSLPPHVQQELEALAARYGRPLVRVEDVPLEGYWSPRLGSLRDVTPEALRAALTQPARTAEVCMVVRRPNGRLIAGTKPFYPNRVFRFLTGGVEPGESVLDALLRETLEETGLQTEVRRFLAAVGYRTPATVAAGHDAPIFYTYAFLLDETGGTLGALDADELLDEYREVDLPEVLELAAALDHLAAADPATLAAARRPRPPGWSGFDLDPRAWHDWGRFRAVSHYLVHQVLTEESSPPASRPRERV